MQIPFNAVYGRQHSYEAHRSAKLCTLAAALVAATLDLHSGVIAGGRIRQASATIGRLRIDSTDFRRSIGWALLAIAA
jgi:hypothetical protein